MSLVPLKRIADLRTSQVGVEPSGLVTLDQVVSGAGALSVDPWEQPVLPPATGVADTQAGDVLFGKLRPYLAKVFQVRRPGYASTELMCLRPKPDVDPRWFFYRMLARPTIEWSVATSDGSKMPRTSWARLSELAVPVPDRGVQQAIADYLDTETARIDALIDAEQIMRVKLFERFQVFAEQTIWHGIGSVMPLKFRTSTAKPIMYGIVLPGPDVPHGVSIVKGGDVAAGRLATTALCRTTPEIEAPFARARLAAKDLVFAIRGGIGDVQMVPADIAGANITQDVARVSPDSKTSSAWLLEVLRTPRVQAEVRARTTGATVRGLNIWDLKRIGVPASDASRQRRDLDKLVPARTRLTRSDEALRTQIALLRERR